MPDLLPPAPICGLANPNATLVDEVNTWIRSWHPRIRVAYGTWDAHKMVNGVAGILLQQLGYSVEFVHVDSALESLRKMQRGMLDFDASVWVRNQSGSHDFLWNDRLMRAVINLGPTGFTGREGIFMRARKFGLLEIADFGRFYTDFNRTDLRRMTQTAAEAADVRSHFGVVRAWNPACTVRPSGAVSASQCPTVLLADGTPGYTSERLLQMVQNASLPLSLTETNLSCSRPLAPTTPAIAAKSMLYTSRRALHWTELS